MEDMCTFVWKATWFHEGKEVPFKEHTCRLKPGHDGDHVCRADVCGPQTHPNVNTA